MAFDVIFDIDGTLANAAHRLHHIVPDPNKFYEAPFEKNWDLFLSDEQVAKDAPIEATWAILTSLLYERCARIAFITGRPERQRGTTMDWLVNPECPIRGDAAVYWQRQREPILLMRKDGDHRPSHVVKEERLHQAILAGLRPQLVFEDRKDDTIMWRRNGLLCCQVAEGNY